MCVFPHLQKTEMKGGAGFTEQLPGFHLVSADLRSHLPQPLFASSLGSHVPWGCWRDLEGVVYMSG